MSVTYTTDTDAASAARTSDTAAPFVPIYARNRKARRSKGGVKTWMILAPIAFVTLGGLGALAFFSGRSDIGRDGLACRDRRRSLITRRQLQPLRPHRPPR